MTNRDVHEPRGTSIHLIAGKWVVTDKVNGRVGNYDTSRPEQYLHDPELQFRSDVAFPPNRFFITLSCARYLPSTRFLFTLLFSRLPFVPKTPISCQISLFHRDHRLCGSNSRRENHERDRTS